MVASDSEYIKSNVIEAKDCRIPLFGRYTDSSLVSILYVVKDILCDVKSITWP
jgi:hypothetical protein